MTTDGAAAISVDGGTTTPDSVTTSFATATFESYSEGASFKPSFTDSLSGIVFSNSTAFSGNFVIEFANSSSWTAPMFQNNKYLGCNGYAPGNGASLAKFGFTATLPQLARTVELDVAGKSDSGTYSVSLLAENSFGDTVASQTVNFIAANPQEYHLRADSINLDIASFLLVTGTNGVDAVDNIGASIPEPGAGIAGIAICVAFGRTLTGRCRTAVRFVKSPMLIAAATTSATSNRTSRS